MPDNLKINLAKLKPIINGHFFVRLDENYSNLLSIFPETMERAKMSLYFAQQIGFTKAGLTKGDIKIFEGYFRASLCEFVSMEDTLRRETKNNLKLFDTRHPLLILLKLLRNLEIHLKTRKLSTQPKQYLWEYTQQIIDVDVFMVDRIELSDLKKLDGYKRFKDEETNITKTLDWFNKATEKWGIVEMIIIGVNEYASEIVSHCIELGKGKEFESAIL